MTDEQNEERGESQHLHQRNFAVYGGMIKEPGAVAQGFEDVHISIDALSFDQRDKVTEALTRQNIAFRYERGTELVVRMGDVDAANHAIATARASGAVVPPVYETPIPAVVEQPIAVFEPAPEPVEVAPVEEPPAPIDVEIAPIEEDLGPGDDTEMVSTPVALGDEVVFDLVDLSVEERRHLSMRLTGAGISYRWEVGTDLMVNSADAELIAHYVEEVANPDGFGDEEMQEFDEDVDDEAIYGAMSNLYVAADKLMQKPGDGPTVNQFYDASDDIDGLPAPFGFDPRVWTQVLALANSIADALDAEADAETIGNDARTLRQLLVNYV